MAPTITPALTPAPTTSGIRSLLAAGDGTQANLSQLIASTASGAVQAAVQDLVQTVAQPIVQAATRGAVATAAVPAAQGVAQPATSAPVGFGGVGAPRARAEFNPSAPNVVSAPAAVSASFGDGAPLSVVSSPSASEPTQGVTLSQARGMVGAPGSPGSPGGAQEGGETGEKEVRVPVSRNSLAEIVNGGVKLPGGVDQMLFVVKQ